MSEITPQYLEQIRKNPKIRRRLAFESPFWFSLIYLRHHFSYPFAPFHLEMFHLVEKSEYQFIVVMAFRESGKSTVMNMANVLWSILGKPEKKFTIVISKTQEQAKDHFTNIKAELESNELLKQDFGPFTENEAAWNKMSLDLVYHGSKILSVMRDQSLRGLKHGRSRPDLIVCDDLEDSLSVESSEEVESIRRRFESELTPLGSADTRIVVLGNFLSKNSLMIRLKSEITSEGIKGIFRAYPLLDEFGKNLWPGKFTDFEALKRLLSKTSEKVWEQEYLLNTLGWGGYRDQAKLFYDDDRPSNKILRIADQKYAELRWRYKDILSGEPPQRALIDQMGEFNITPPANDESRDDPPDPVGQRYERYKEYKKELEKIVREYEKEFKKTIMTKRC